MGNKKESGINPFKIIPILHYSSTSILQYSITPVFYYSSYFDFPMRAEAIVFFCISLVPS